MMKRPHWPFRSPRPLALAAALGTFLAATTAECAESPGGNHTPRMSYLDNGVIKLGIDLNLGGAITYLSPSGTNAELNVINSYGNYLAVGSIYY